jgi:predicted DNA repair protein MutK
MTKKPAFADIAGLPEDDRIDIIGHNAVTHKKVVGFIVEDDAKADRYLQKLTAKFPGIQVIYRGSWRNTVLVKVGPPAEGKS